MSINRNGSTPGNETAQNVGDRPAPGYSSAQPSAGQNRSQQRGLGVSEIGAVRLAAISRLGAGETVDSFKRAIEKQLESLSADQRDNFQLVVMNRETDRVYNSTLIIARPIEYGGKVHVLAYALPVEASNPINEARVFQGAGQTSEISWAASDLLDSRFTATMTRFLQNKWGAEAQVVYAGGRPLPVELKADDSAHLLRVLYEADQALITATEKYVTHASAAVVSAAMFRNDNARASVNVIPQPIDSDDSVGNPVRAGITIELSATRNIGQAQANQSLHDRDQDIRLTRVQAYVDPTYDTRHLQQAPAYAGAPQDSRCFLPRIVIRTVDTEQQMPLTKESHLLGVLSTTALANNIGLWANSLRPRNFTNASVEIQRMTDVGGLGLIAPLNPQNREDLQRISTDPREFSDADFESLISRTFVHTEEQGPFFTLLVEEAGERSWLTDVYIYAADGDPDALNELVETANNLSDGHFERLWRNEPDQRMVHNDQNRVHMGYFIDGKSNRVDMHYADTLAMVNLYAEKDRQLVSDFIQTYNPATGSLEQRLSRREQILRNTFNQLTIKGYGRLVTFFPRFLEVANQSLRAAGLEIIPANLRAGEFQTRPQFGVLDPSLFSMGSGRTGGVFTHSQIGMGTGSYRGIGGVVSGNYGL